MFLPIFLNAGRFDKLLTYLLQYAVALKNIAMGRMDWHSCTTLLHRLK